MNRNPGGEGKRFCVRHARAKKKTARRQKLGDNNDGIENSPSQTVPTSPQSGGTAIWEVPYLNVTGVFCKKGANRRRGFENSIGRPSTVCPLERLMGGGKSRDIERAGASSPWRPPSRKEKEPQACYDLKGTRKTTFFSHRTGKGEARAREKEKMEASPNARTGKKKKFNVLTEEATGLSSNGTDGRTRP